MTLSLEAVEVYSIGTESLEVLGFTNERDLEAALIRLMQDQEEIEPEDLIAA